nr:hypothetical protein [Planctomycetota bacterium]
MPTIRSWWFVPTLLSMFVIAGCDNVGRAFDTPDDTPPVGGASLIEVVPVGGDVRDGRPTVRATYPEGAGWPTAVPVVVEFSESVNQASILPTTPNGLDGRVVLRVKGTTQVLPCLYDFLAAGRLLVLRPLTELSNNQTPTYEVALLPDARDADGVRFDVPTGGKVLSEFQVNQDAAITDGRILATFPRDNQRDLARESKVIVVFDRRPNPATLLPTNLFVRLAGEPTGLLGALLPPLQTVGIPDARVIEFTPAAPLVAEGAYELVVNDAITFGTEGKLDFRGRTPFVQFETVGPAAPLSVHLRNSLPDPANPALATYPNQINIDRIADASLVVTTPLGTAAGDRVLVRIYGGDARSAASGDLAFVERSAVATAADVQQIVVPFTGALGSLTRPQFDDGELTFTAQMQRGSRRSAVVHAPNNGDLAPRFDITKPRLVRAGPPGSADGLDLFSDLDYVAFYGIASERLAGAELTTQNGQLQTVTATMFASDEAGRFVMRPLPIGREPGTRPFTMLLTDRAGNLSESIAGGSFRQRGFVTGTLTDTLVVEAYDQATLLPIAGASVLVDVGPVTLPRTDQRQGVTGADGRVSFATAPGPHTVTIVRAGYDLITLHDTRAGFVSLPLRPVAAAAANATLEGRLEFEAVASSIALASSSAVASRNPLGIKTEATAPKVVPDLAVLPNRPHVVTAFAAAAVEPTGRPTFFAQGCSLGAADITVVSPPAPPIQPGATSRQTLSLVAGLSVEQLTQPFLLDLSTSNITPAADQRPIVRVTASLEGFETQSVVGIGFAPPASNGVFTIDCDYGVAVIDFLKSFGAVPWVVTELTDNSGRVLRVRGLLSLEFGNVQQPAVTLIADLVAPGSGVTFQGSPLVEFDDRLEPSISPFFRVYEVTAQDPSGRRWTVLGVDRDAATGTDQVQFPDLATAGVAGLAPGNWSVRVETRLLTSVTQSEADNLMLTERVRQEINYTRSSAVTY